VYILSDGGDHVSSLASLAFKDSFREDRDQGTWKVEFDGWDHLSPAQKSFLLIVIGDCAGEWWGAGRAVFGSRQAALDAITRSIVLGATSSAPILAH
jgi:hypothetical protein